MKVVLVNSIGIDSNGFYIIHSPSRWSQGVKHRQNWFAYYPWELAYLSSLIKAQTDFSVKLIDGCLNRDSSYTLFEKISKEQPDWLVMEPSTRVFQENLQLANKVKDRFNTKLVFVGQHASSFPDDLLANGVDYVCMGEYEQAVLELLKAKSSFGIEGVYPNERGNLVEIENLPWPEDYDVSRLAYAYPGEPSSEFIEIQMYATRGCLRQCNFCVAANVYYKKPNYRMRRIFDIVEEIKYLKAKYPVIEGIFFDEEVHNANKDFTLNLCQAIIDSKLNKLHFEAMCDLMLFDKEMLQKMKEAGYYKIRFGIESSSKEVMQAIGKVIPEDALVDKLNQAKQAGLKTYGAFTVGASGSTKQLDKNTLNLIKQLMRNKLLDNLQISICTPQPGTPFYEHIKRNNYLATKDFNKYDGGNFSVIDYPYYKKEEIEEVARNGYLIRDHSYLWRKVFENQLFKWLFFVYKKYGLVDTIKKLIKRVAREIKFYNYRICRKF